MLLFCGLALITIGYAWVDTLMVSPNPTVTLSINGHVLHAEIADTPDKQRRGLMHREHLKPDHGMLFVFDDRRRRCFWMKDTLIPLTVAFIGEDRRIQSLHIMTPHSREPHCSKQPATRALEMPQGWFRRRSIEPGDYLSIMPHPP